MFWLTILMLILLGLAVVGSGWTEEAEPAPDMVQGQKLFQRLGCRSCHTLANTGGKIGPSLDNVGQRLARADLEQQLTRPASRRPRTGMPSFAFLKPAELSALLNYLQTLK
ncbi:MAG: cytochrome c [Desulfobacca sp.]|nr:cytochrome c [Desulfobacca sp.]